MYGPEGSGKTTQGKIISRKYGLAYLSTGEMIREFSQKKEGALSRACRTILDRGIYLKDRDMYRILKVRLLFKDAGAGFILDGFPRSLKQAAYLDRWLKKQGKKIDRVIFLKIDRETAIRRILKRNRDKHDSLTKIKPRLGSYYRHEKAILAYYRRRKILTLVDGNSSISNVTDIITALA